MSKIQKLVSYMKSGNEVTARQISGTFGLKNPSRAIHALRTEHGICVYSNPTTLSTGDRVVKSRIGTPSKRMVAVAANILGASAFTR